MRGFLVLTFATLISLGGPSASRADEFPLQDGTIWVMAGDSITAQHLHSNYFEAFCYARYPSKTFAFRNSGVGGHTIPTTLARFGYDVAAWNPTIVSVELGMNDQGRFTTEEYIANMRKMLETIRNAKAQPVLLTASPINNGDTLTKLTANKRLHEYAIALKKLADTEKVPFADQFHGLVDIWGNNKSNEILANTLPNLRNLAKEPNLVGGEHLKLFLAAQEQVPNKPLSMQGDPVHPGPVGQLMMAASLLKALHAEPFVSSAEIDATGKLVEAKGCVIDQITVKDGTVSFDRLDEKLPFPIPDDARAVLSFDPTIYELSQYMLAVSGLKEGNYALKVNGIPLGSPQPATAWAKGVNITALAYENATKPNVITNQAKAILNAVTAKESVVSNFRGLSQRASADGAEGSLKSQLADLFKKVEAADALIRAAAKPSTLKFELIAVK